MNDELGGMKQAGTIQLCRELGLRRAEPVEARSPDHFDKLSKPIFIEG